MPRIVLPVATGAARGNETTSDPPTDDASLIARFALRHDMPTTLEPYQAWLPEIARFAFWPFDADMSGDAN